MKKSIINSFSIIFLSLLMLVNAYAATNATFVTLTSYPTYLHANENYVINWNVTDTTNASINTTAMFYKNGVNILNKTYTNNQSFNNGSNSYTFTVLEGNYSYNDIVSTNVTATEAGNFSARNSTATGNLTIQTSTTALIQGDAFDFLSGLGVNLNSFVSALVAPIGSLILVLGLAAAIVAMIAGLAVLVQTGLKGAKYDVSYRSKTKK